MSVRWHPHLFLLWPQDGGEVADGPGRARPRGAAAEVSWLLRTKYIAADSTEAKRDTRMRAPQQGLSALGGAEGAEGEAAARAQRSREAVVEEIEESFRAAQRPPVHPKDPSLRAVEILPGGGDTQQHALACVGASRSCSDLKIGILLGLRVGNILDAPAPSSPPSHSQAQRSRFATSTTHPPLQPFTVLQFYPTISSLAGPTSSPPSMQIHLLTWNNMLTWTQRQRPGWRRCVLFFLGGGGGQRGF